MTVSPEQRLFALWVAVVTVAAIGLVVIFGGFAGAAELNYCKIYANRMSAMALQRLVGVPFVDVSTGRFLYRKAYSSCILAEEEPPSFCRRAAAADRRHAVAADAPRAGAGINAGYRSGRCPRSRADRTQGQDGPDRPAALYRASFADNLHRTALAVRQK